MSGYMVEFGGGCVNPPRAGAGPGSITGLPSSSKAGTGDQSGELDLAGPGLCVAVLAGAALGLAGAALGLAGAERRAGAVGLGMQHAGDRPRLGRGQRDDRAGDESGRLGSATPRAADPTASPAFLTFC